jgi:large conductance mechanosensitive channel
MLKDFKEFILKGNVVDISIGLLIAAAFGAVTVSLVKNVITPLIAVFGKHDFTNLYFTLKEGVSPLGGTVPGPYGTLADAQKAGAVTLNYGLFLNDVINLLIVGLVAFMIVKAITKMIAKRPPTPEPALPEPTKEELLLTEIRDLLKAKS